MTIWQYLSTKAKDQKNEGTWLSTTLKVGKEIWGRGRKLGNISMFYYVINSDGFPNVCSVKGFYKTMETVMTLKKSFNMGVCHIQMYIVNCLSIYKVIASVCCLFGCAFFESVDTFTGLLSTHTGGWSLSLWWRENIQCDGQGETGQEIAVMLQFDFWAQKLRQCCNFWAQKLRLCSRDPISWQL